MIDKKRIEEDIFSWFRNEFEINLLDEDLEKNLFHDLYLDSFQYICFLEFLSKEYKFNMGKELLDSENQNINYVVKNIVNVL
jgi:acyl carrier protein